MASTRIVGASVPRLNSRSLPGLRFLNISFKLPAIVASVMGLDNSPFFIQTPKMQTKTGLVINQPRNYIELEITKNHINFYLS